MNPRPSAPKAEVITSEYIRCMYKRELVRVPLSEVTHFSADSKYVVAYAGDVELILRSSLDTIECLLGDLALRIHRRCIVLRDHASKIKRDACTRTYKMSVAGKDFVVSRLAYKRLAKEQKQEAPKISADNATHELKCTMHTPMSTMGYTLPCHVLKSMPDGRVKVVVFGSKYKRQVTPQRVMYVPADRVVERVSA